LFSKLRVGITLVLVACGMLAFAAPAQAAQPASTTETAAKASKALRLVLLEGTRTPVPRPANAAAEACATYDPGVSLTEVATGILLYTQRLVVQYCIDGTVVTRLQAPTFSDVLIQDSRVIILERLPIGFNGNPPIALYDTQGSVNIRFRQTATAAPLDLRVTVRVAVDGLGRQSFIYLVR
jgi:hypothetical protein